MPKIPASERDAFYEARRSEIVAVALKLWSEQGFDQTSVARIAREAGLSKGTFYLYFESKQALLEEVLRRNSLVPNVLQLLQDLQQLSLEEAVHAFVRGAWSRLLENRDLILVALRELPTHLEEARQLVERVMVPANRLLADYFESRMDPARARELSLPIAVRGLPGIVFFTFLTQEVLGIGRVIQVPEDEIVATLADLFLHGVVPLRAPQET